MKKLSLICAALILSACGGSGGDTVSIAPPLTPAPAPPAPGPVGDIFFTSLSNLVSTQPDDTEPGEPGLTPTEPEDTEPPSV